MTWKLTDWAKTRLPLPGVPWRDMSDEEFATASSRVPELEERGYFAQGEPSYGNEGALIVTMPEPDGPEWDEAWEAIRKVANDEAEEQSGATVPVTPRRSKKR